MKLQLAIALAATVIRGALANPVPEPAPATDAAAKGPQTCNILADSLNCRYHPYTDSSIVHVFHGGSAYFTCDHRGTTVSGNPWWDYNPDYDCFVSAHYTGDNCNENTLPECPFEKARVV